MSTWQVALWGLAAVQLLMLGGWAVSVVRRDASLVDRLWGVTFILYAWVYAWLGDGAAAREVLLGVLVTVWGLRLTGYITWRNWGEGEDPRYRAMRERDPERFAVRSLFTIFWGQGLLAWVVAAPLLAAATDASPARLIWVDLLGGLLWMAGFFFEAVGDHELSRFLSHPANRGKVMDRGLWRYTRHPNYFGDATLWWGFGLVGLATGSWWAVVGPVTMSVLIVKVSGVALTEERMSGEGSSREGYDEYVRRTNAFFPGPPSE